MTNVAILGGDERALWLSRLMKAAGMRVHTKGLVAGDEVGEIPQNVDVALLPYPFASWQGVVRGLTGWSLPLQQALQCLPAGIPVLGGKLEEEKVRPERYIDLTMDEKLQAENASISAEGAVMAAARHLTETLENLPVVVTGYGLLGRKVTEKLHALGARVLVAARDPQARERARELGAEACDFSALPCRARQTACLMNTVPFPVVERELLQTLPPDCLLLELASAPYGINREAAQRLGMTVLVLPRIPASYAPQSAARALLSAVCRSVGGMQA